MLQIFSPHQPKPLCSRFKEDYDFTRKLLHSDFVPFSRHLPPWWQDTPRIDNVSNLDKENSRNLWIPNILSRCTLCFTDGFMMENSTSCAHIIDSVTTSSFSLNHIRIFLTYCHSTLYQTYWILPWIEFSSYFWFKERFVFYSIN